MRRYEIYMISQDRFVTTERHRLLHVNEASGERLWLQPVILSLNPFGH